MSNTCVTVECKDWISTVTIDNPPDNYLDKDVLSRLNKTVSEVYARPGRPSRGPARGTGEELLSRHRLRQAS